MLIDWERVKKSTIIRLYFVEFSRVIHIIPLMVFGFSETPITRVHPGATTFPPVCAFMAIRVHPLPAICFSVPTITDGYTRTRQGYTITQPLRKPDCTLSRLFALLAEEYDRPVTQSIATPEPGCPGPHARSSRSSLRPWMCHHTLEPTVLPRVSCRPASES